MNAVVEAGADYQLVSDRAAIELQTRDVGRDAVLLGPYSREEFNHPGPALYYLLALPYRATGSESVGILLGALVINGLAMAGMALLARRRGGIPLALCALLLIGLLTRAIGPNFLRDPWNPYVTVLPFGLLLFLSWAMCCGESWAVPGAAAVGSFVVQSHLGYGLVTVGLLLWGCAGLAHALRPHGDRVLAASVRRGLRKPALATVAVLGLMWLPPIIEQTTKRPGNMRRIGEFLADPHDLHSLGEAYRVVVAQFSGRPEWLTGAEAPSFTGEIAALARTAPVPVLLLMFIGAALVLWRRRDRNGLLLAGTVAVGILLEFVSVWRLQGPVFPYLIRWEWILGLTTGLVIVWAALLLLPRRYRSSTGWPALAVALGLAVVSVINGIAAGRASAPFDHQADRATSLSRAVLESLPPGDNPVLLRRSSYLGVVYGAGLALQLERHGVPVRVESPVYGTAREYDGEPVRTVLTVAVSDDIERLLEENGTRLVARVEERGEDVAVFASPRP